MPGVNKRTRSNQIIAFNSKKAKLETVKWKELRELGYTKLSIGIEEERVKFRSAVSLVEDTFCHELWEEIGGGGLRSQILLTSNKKNAKKKLSEADARVANAKKKLSE